MIGCNVYRDAIRALANRTVKCACCGGAEWWFMVLGLGIGKHIVRVRCEVCLVGLDYETGVLSGESVVEDAKRVEGLFEEKYRGKILEEIERS